MIEISISLKTSLQTFMNAPTISSKLQNCIAGKRKSFFSIKSEKKYLSCNIYQRIYKFKKDYIGETERNIKTRWIKAIIQHKI